MMRKLLYLIANYKYLILIVILASFLRLWKLGSIPPSLYFDELDLGYQAYSILHTGRDYFGNFLPLHPHSFAEFRTPFNIYSAIPTVAIFGINQYGVRLPSVFFGILSVFLMFFLIYEITKNKRVALLSALILALSPWHIQFSRVTLEVLALFVFDFGNIFIFKKYE